MFALRYKISSLSVAKGRKISPALRSCYIIAISIKFQILNLVIWFAYRISVWNLSFSG